VLINFKFVFLFVSGILIGYYCVTGAIGIQQSAISNEV